jgi:hypothetical protein
MSTSGVTMIYRKSVQGAVWHCCRNCRYWPEGRGKYLERNSKPVSGELCDRCQLMISDGGCAPLLTIRVSSRRLG